MHACSPLLPLTFALVALIVQAPAQEGLAAEMENAVRQQATEKILTERTSQEAFNKAISDARSMGVAEQAILEARFLYHVDLEQHDAIGAMLPDFMKRRAVFKLAESEIFSVEEDWLAVLEYVQAIVALNKGDQDAFKRHITEAFWLSPGQAAAYAPLIESLRMRESMARVKLDFSQGAISLNGGAAVALSNLIKGNKAMLLHFWSPWSRECVEAMDDFSATAEMLSKHEIAVVSLIPPDIAALATDARETIRSLSGAEKSVWLIDSDEGALAQMLRVRQLPTMVLVSAEGKVLFNGVPTDEQFWTALRTVDRGIEQAKPSKVEGQ